MLNFASDNLRYKICLKKYFCMILNKQKLIFIIAALILVSSGNIKPQSKTNLDIFYTFVDSAVHVVNTHLTPADTLIVVDLQLGTAFNVFGNRIMNGILGQNRRLYKGERDADYLRVTFVVDNSSVTYGDMFRDGVFGRYLLPRTITLTGNFSISFQDYTFDDFVFTKSDTVRVDEISQLENPSFIFTQGKLPSEPFFSSLLEPVIAVGAAAAAIILFFTVRSK